MTLSSLEIRLARVSLERIRKQLADEEREYERLVRECAEDGFAPSHCRHGTYLWVDWDVMCPRCEDGDPNIYEWAIGEAKKTMREYRARQAAATAFSDKAFEGGVGHGIEWSNIAISVDAWVFQPVSRHLALG